MNLSDGQYRKVRYTSDGCAIYQCLWCKSTIETRDDPHYGYNFCPKCGKSWFRRKECRTSDIPRWAYDRWGNNVPADIPLHPFKVNKKRWEIQSQPRTRGPYVLQWVYAGQVNHEGLHSWQHVLRRIREMKLKNSHCAYRAVIV